MSAIKQNDEELLCKDFEVTVNHTTSIRPLKRPQISFIGDILKISC